MKNFISSATVIPAKAGIQSIEQTPRSGTVSGFVRYAEINYLNWIPACAGMTVKRSP
jgi:hypothetical protein